MLATLQRSAVPSSPFHTFRPGAPGLARDRRRPGRRPRLPAVVVGGGRAAASTRPSAPAARSPPARCGGRPTASRRPTRTSPSAPEPVQPGDGHLRAGRQGSPTPTASATCTSSTASTAAGGAGRSATRSCSTTSHRAARTRSGPGRRPGRQHRRTHRPLHLPGHRQRPGLTASGPARSTRASSSPCGTVAVELTGRSTYPCCGLRGLSAPSPPPPPLPRRASTPQRAPAPPHGAAPRIGAPGGRRRHMPSGPVAGASDVHAVVVFRPRKRPLCCTGSRCGRAAGPG